MGTSNDILLCQSPYIRQEELQEVKEHQIQNKMSNIKSCKPGMIAAVHRSSCCSTLSKSGWIAAALEDRERLEHLVVKDFKNDAKGHRERLNQGHRVAAMLDQLQSQSHRLVSLDAIPPSSMTRVQGIIKCLNLPTSDWVVEDT